MKRTQTVAATTNPITLAEARTWLAFESGVTEDDPLITDLIGSVTAYVERRLNGRKLISQTWKLTLDASEVGASIRVPLVPLQSVTSIVTTNDAGATTTVDVANYQVITGEVPRIVLKSAGSWPSDMRDAEGMAITCVVGYGAAADVPNDLKLIIKHILSHQYASKGMGVYQTVSGQVIGTPYIAENAIKSMRLEPWA